MKAIIYVIVLLFLVNIVHGAEIYGTVYDMDLEKAKDVIITIDSVPKQKVVSKLGNYSFSVGQGEYEITAKYYENNLLESSVIEKISVKGDGRYSLDLILFPYIGDDEELVSGLDDVVGADLDEIVEEEQGMNFMVLSGYVLVAVLAFILLYYFLFIRKRSIIDGKSMDIITVTEDLDKVVEFIKKEGGRTTQKDIRNEFPLSEAKISLMISELENKGVLQRIKKGRGNIIVLKR